MNRRLRIPTTKVGRELEQALSEWLAASRRTYAAPAHDVQAEIDEHAAWKQVEMLIGSSRTATA